MSHHQQTRIVDTIFWAVIVVAAMVCLMLATGATGCQRVADPLPRQARQHCEHAPRTYVLPVDAFFCVSDWLRETLTGLGLIDTPQSPGRVD